MGVMCWVQDCYKAPSNIPNHEPFDEETLLEALSIEQIQRSDMMELVATNSKTADPGQFKDEPKWPKWWEKVLTNYLSVIPGVSRIPLSYMASEQDEPTPGMEYSTFMSKQCIGTVERYIIFKGKTQRIGSTTLQQGTKMDVVT